jgi:wobble nucleotide-excising tRNase
MISKISMQDVASYKSQTALQTDKKVNLIYGLNGSGKSTLSNYLYDTSGSAYGACSLDVANNISLYVYNQKFIEDHFYEADRLRGIFSLSKENKDIEEKLEIAQSELLAIIADKEKEEESANKRLTALDRKKSDAYGVTWKIKTQFTGGDRVLEDFLQGLKGNKETLYSHLSSVTKPDTKPSQDIASLKKNVEAIKGDDAKTHDLLPSFEFDEEEVEKDVIFAQAIVGSKNSSVAGLIERLNNSDWVKDGLKYVSIPPESSTVSCPFCQSETITNQLVQDIEGYFDESYEESTRRIESLEIRYREAAGSLSTLEIYKSNPFSSAHGADLAENHAALVALLERNLEKIQEKKDSPSSVQQLESSKQVVDAFNAVIVKINDDTTVHNTKLGNLETELQTLKREFWSLMRWEYDQTISALSSEIRAFEKEQAESKTRLDKFKMKEKEKRSEISQLQKSTVNIEEAIGHINEGLVQIGVSDFSISRHDNSLYKIVRSNDSDASFFSLSEGEKMIISFLYFCELCKGKREATEVPGKKIAIIDDPISSLSHVFVFNIGRLIKSEFFDSKAFEQVFVLTHSLYFFYELADSNHKNRKETQKLFRLFKNDSGSQIVKMSYEEVQNDYHSYWSIITDPDQPPALIANCMRNIVEYFFNFVQKQDLSNVVQFPELQENRFQAFCRYINRESHSLGQNVFDFKEFDYESFREGLRLVFQVTGYENHYIKMLSVFGNE